MWGGRDGSVAIKRTGYYAADYELLPLSAERLEQIFGSRGIDLIPIKRMGSLDRKSVV